MDQPDTSDHPFSVEFVRALVNLMSDRDLSVVDLKWREARIRLVRGSVAPNIGAALASVPAGAPPSGAPSAPVPSAPPAAAAKPAQFITSSLVGTFFVASSPESEPYVRVGSKVGEDTVVCMIEAMKVFNEIPAGLSGTIVEVMVENGAPVEYGQPLFRVET